MLGWSITFLIVALIAAILGFAGIAGTAAWIAQVLFVAFLILFIISLFFGRRFHDIRPSCIIYYIASTLGGTIAKFRPKMRKIAE